ncbi:MAG TPA: glycyl-radical enzyme activating protein [Gemmatimonadales bacterium]|nr:glycyl-radical enzyme activating protein [Gemmatimonadales bacterium]
MATGIVFDIRRYSIHDGPGIRTTVFLKGCALSCLWCHNPESQSSGPDLILRESRCIRCGACVEACPNGAITWTEDGPVTDRAKCRGSGRCAALCFAEARSLAGRTMSVEEVMEIVERDRPFFEESGGGLTLSGGEPLLQPYFSAALLRAAKARGIHTALDTCGHASWRSLDRLRKDVDLFLYDVKMMDDERHRLFTGAPNRRILENLRALAKHGHRIVLRVPVVPGINDDDDNLDAVRRFAAGLPSLEGLDLLPYHRVGVDKYARVGRSYPLPDTLPPPRERLVAVAETLAAAGLPVGRRVSA